MYTANKRVYDEAAEARVVEHFDYIPASQVRNIIRRFHHERWVTEVSKNNRVMALVSMTVGFEKPWSWPTTSKVKRGVTYVYLQTVDINRARLVLDEPKARWQLFRRGGAMWVRREA